MIHQPFFTLYVCTYEDKTPLNVKYGETDEWVLLRCSCNLVTRVRVTIEGVKGGNLVLAIEANQHGNKGLDHFW